MEEFSWKIQPKFDKKIAESDDAAWATKWQVWTIKGHEALVLRRVRFGTRPAEVTDYIISRAIIGDLAHQMQEAMASVQQFLESK